MDEHEYREQLNKLEEELSDVYRRRRALLEQYADDHEPILPPPRYRTDHQARVARCPRCSQRLDSDIPGAKICTDPGCSLPDGHDGLHVPLPVLWQEAGYVAGPWAK